ncbi:MAG TPA: hypothetical protein VGO67_04995 [Verrucomicrobiae bacterium]
MKTREVKMLWKLVKSCEARRLLGEDLALLLRVRFELRDYETQSGGRMADERLQKRG